MSDSHRSDTELLELAHAISDLDHPVKVETAQWAATHLAQRDRVDADLHAQFAHDDWQACAERGIHGLFVPAELGGNGASLATALLTLEGLGQGCRDNGLVYALCSQMLSTQQTLVEFASAEQQATWLTPMLRGEQLGAFAMTEPDVGSDAYTISATARRTDDGWTIDAHKAYITLASRCDFVIVFASTKPDAGRWGISAFVVPMDAPGVERSPNRDKMGMRTTPFGDIVLRDVHVPADALIGKAGAGASIFNAVVQFERAFVFATQVGAMERQLGDAIAYAQQRVQGGQAIARHQVIAHRIADMKQQHETARLFVYRAAIAMASGKATTMSAALAKIVGSDTGIELAMNAASIGGARGYVSEFEVERDLRDAIGGLVYSGTSDIQRNIIARLLGVGS
ncbi:MAG: acyl-CoA dehydrogenase family protein [Ilumatobacter sp.]|uniref:acyl-CoA dehydrogenase family protein n=1 Tax=Ilumatobacter sp. TaxID=1967498 RepID=UPI00391DB1E2